MNGYCDRSPCTSFLNSLGEWVFGRLEEHNKQGWYLRVVKGDADEHLVKIDYCPFCGTRLDQTEVKVLDRYKLPTNGKRRTASSSIRT